MVIRRNALVIFYSNASNEKKNILSNNFYLLDNVLGQKGIPNFWQDHKVKLVGSASAAVVFLVIAGSTMCCYKRRLWLIFY